MDSKQQQYRSEPNRECFSREATSVLERRKQDASFSTQPFLWSQQAHVPSQGNPPLHWTSRDVELRELYKLKETVQAMTQQRNLPKKRSSFGPHVPLPSFRGNGVQQAFLSYLLSNTKQQSAESVAESCFHVDGSTRYGHSTASTVCSTVDYGDSEAATPSYCSTKIPKARGDCFVQAQRQEIMTEKASQRSNEKLPTLLPLDSQARIDGRGLETWSTSGAGGPINCESFFLPPEQRSFESSKRPHPYLLRILSDPFQHDRQIPASRSCPRLPEVFACRCPQPQEDNRRDEWLRMPQNESSTQYPSTLIQQSTPTFPSSVVFLHPEFMVRDGHVDPVQQKVIELNVTENKDTPKILGEHSFVTDICVVAAEIWRLTNCDLLDGSDETNVNDGTHLFDKAVTTARAVVWPIGCKEKQLSGVQQCYGIYGTLRKSQVISGNPDAFHHTWTPN